RQPCVKATAGHRGHRTADPVVAVAGFTPDLDRAGPTREAALGETQRHIRWMHTMLDEVGGRWAGRASGGNVLDPTGVVPGPPFGSGGIEHIDELGATRSE